MTKELVIKKELTTYEKSAQELIIKTEKDMEGAVSLLSNINKVLDKATEEKERVTKPLNEALKAERSRWKPIETACESAISAIKAKLTAYQRGVEALRSKKEAELEKSMTEGKITPATASRRLEALPEIRQTVTTGAGAIQWRTVRKVEVFDISLLPSEYLIPDDTKIRKEALAGTAIPGVRVVEEKVPANFR